MHLRIKNMRRKVEFELLKSGAIFLFLHSEIENKGSSSLLYETNG